MKRVSHVIQGILFSTAALWALSVRAARADLRAFGEAEGFGAVATGARATATPTIYHVTNLNATGAGSFADAVSAGNRIVVFDVGGVINLSTAVAIKSNVTIAGQTAPGGGILFTGHELSTSDQSNIIIRHLRVSPGDGSPSTDDAIAMHNSNTVIMDHVSLAFANWNNIDAVTDNGAASQYTVQNSIVADPINQQFVAHTEASNGAFTWSNNLLVNSHNRTPLAKVDTIFKDNIDYNDSAAYTVADTSGKFQHDIINNYFIGGPGTTAGNTFYQMNSNQTVFSSGNLRDTNQNSVLDGSSVSPSGIVNATANNFTLTANLPTVSAADAFTFVTAHAGASIARDDLDQLIVAQTRTLGNGTTGYTASDAGPDGGMYHHASQTGLVNGGLGTIASVARPAGFDTDQDGIPDAWEVAHGMNPNNASDALLRDPLGYFMIEKYINELGNVNDTRTWSAAAGSWTTAANWAGTSPTPAPSPFDYAQIRGNGTTNGAVTLASGAATAMTVSIGGNGPVGGESLTITGGKLDVYDTITVGDQNNATMQISGNGVVETYNLVLGNSTFSATAAINYTGTLNLLGGTLSLAQLVRGGGTPANGFNTGGAVNFSGGTLRAVDTLRITAPITLSNAPVIDTNGFSGTISSVLSGAGGFTKIGAGTLTLSGSNTFSGTLTLQNDTVAVVTLSNATVAGSLGSGADASKLVFNGGRLQFTGSSSSVSNRLFTVTTSGGTLDSSGSTAVAFNGAGAIAYSGTGSRTFTLSGTNTGHNTFSPAMADPTGGTLAINKTGTGKWTFDAANAKTYSGDTHVIGGTLESLAANAFSRNSNMVIDSGATLELHGNSNTVNGLGGAGTVANSFGTASQALTVGANNGGGNFSGGMSGAMAFSKIGTGTQTLSGTYNYSGATTVNGGMLVVTNGLTASSGVTLNAGTLQLAGTTNAMTVPLAIAGSAGNWSAKLDLTSNAVILQSTTSNKSSLLSTLQNQITSASSNGTNAGNGITSSTAAGDPMHFAVGLFDNAIVNKSTFAGVALTTSSLIVTQALIGDANFDGHVNAADLAVLAANWNSHAATNWAMGDINNDGIVDSLDADQIVSHWDSGTAYAPLLNYASGFSYALVPVPEPATAELLLLAMPLLARRSRRYVLV